MYKKLNKHDTDIYYSYFLLFNNSLALGFHTRVLLHNIDYFKYTFVRVAHVFDNPVLNVTCMFFSKMCKRVVVVATIIKQTLKIAQSVLNCSCHVFAFHS